MKSIADMFADPRGPNATKPVYDKTEPPPGPTTLKDFRRLYKRGESPFRPAGGANPQTPERPELGSLSEFFRR